MGKLKDYTRKDISEIRNYLVAKLDEIVDEQSDDTKKRWTDHNESDLGMLFIELASGIADMLNFNIDKQALETYLSSAIQRKNVKGIVSLVNYQVKSPVAAITMGKFTLIQPLSFDLTIPKYFQVSYERNEGNIYYATAQDCQILKGQTEVTVPLLQGIVNNTSLTVRDLFRSRTLYIMDTKVAHKSVELIVDGTKWTQVDDVLTDDDYGTKFSIHEDKNDNSFIEFGYSWKNYLPANTKAPVSIMYLQTEGSNGAIKQGMINKIEDSITIDGTDYANYLSVTNLDDASGGADRESISTIRTKAPRMVSTHEMMTVLSDYEIIAENFPGVYKAKAVDWTINNGEYTGVPYRVLLYIVTNDKSYTCNTEFLQNLYNYLLQYKWSSIKLTCEPAVIKDINIMARVHTSADKSNYVGIKRMVEDTLTDYFTKLSQNFNAVYTIGSLESVIKSSSNLIEYCEIISPTESIKLREIEFPRLNSVDITVGEV